jgi:hypothetical protein
MRMTNMSDSRHLDLAVRKVQDNISLVNIPDLNYLDLIVS